MYLFLYSHEIYSHKFNVNIVNTMLNKTILKLETYIATFQGIVDLWVMGFMGIYFHLVHL